MRTNVLHFLRKDSKAEQTVSHFIQRNRKGGEANTTCIFFLVIKHTQNLTKQKGQNLEMTCNMTLKLQLESICIVSYFVNSFIQTENTF